MRTRTVRLDEEEERQLETVMKRTGLTASAVLKRGVREVHGQLAAKRSFWEVYEKLDLGPGGYALAPAADAKRAVREIIRRKHERERER
jgi:hypothetical protein